MNNLKRKAAMAVLLSASLAGCGGETTVSDISLPSGESAHVAQCRDSSEQCLAKATAICGGPYRALDSESRAGDSRTPGFVQGATFTWFKLVFACGKPDGRMPDFPLKGVQPPATVGDGGGNNARFTSCQRNGQAINCYGF